MICQVLYSKHLWNHFLSPLPTMYLQNYLIYTTKGIQMQLKSKQSFPTTHTQVRKKKPQCFPALLASVHSTPNSWKFHLCRTSQDHPVRAVKSSQQSNIIRGRLTGVSTCSLGWTTNVDFPKLIRIERKNWFERKCVHYNCRAHLIISGNYEWN